MKTNLRVVAFFICVTLTACTKEKIVPPAPDTPEMAIARSAIEKTTESITSGNWYITRYMKANLEKTESFKTYSFSFASNGNLIAAQGGQNLVGKWVIAYIDNLTRLNLTFSAPALFIEMSGDWVVVEESENKIKMQDVVRPADLIIFEKK